MVTENQTNHVVATGINRPVTVTQYHLLRNNGCRKSQRHNENHGSRRIKHLFLVSRKMILQNHASRLLWKSRFKRKKLAISHFTGKKKGRSRVTKIPFTTLLAGTLLRREERNISSNLSRIVLMDKLQVISQIIFDGELMIFMTMTLGLRIGCLLIKSISS